MARLFILHYNGFSLFYQVWYILCFDVTEFKLVTYILFGFSVFADAKSSAADLQYKRPFSWQFGYPNHKLYAGTFLVGKEEIILKLFLQAVVRR